MSDFLQLLKNNRNYRYTWSGQVVSEIGDHFNNIAVFSLALANTRSGMVVTGVMLARAIPAVMAGPLAGSTPPPTPRRDASLRTHQGIVQRRREYPRGRRAGQPEHPEWADHDGYRPARDEARRFLPVPPIFRRRPGGRGR